MRKTGDGIAERKCSECGRMMRGAAENYRYTECDLKGVVLCDVMVFRCPHCGANEVDIPNMDGLHRMMALTLVRKASPLAADEIRFLRKVAGFTASEFAKEMGVTKVAVSRWENGVKIGRASDRAIRGLCGFHILAEILKGEGGAIDAIEVLKTAQRILRDLKSSDALIEVVASKGDTLFLVDPAFLAMVPATSSSSEQREVIQ